MRDRIYIDDQHSRAICREIGERLQVYYVRVEPDIPASFRGMIDRLHKLEQDRSSPPVPDREEGARSERGPRGRKSRPPFSWLRGWA